MDFTSNHKDVHKAQASKIFNVPYSHVTKAQREYAKKLNYTLSYTPVKDHPEVMAKFIRAIKEEE